MNDGTPVWYSLLLYMLLIALLTFMFESVNSKLEQLTQENADLIECKAQNNELILYTDELLNTNDSLLNHIQLLSYDKE